MVLAENVLIGSDWIEIAPKKPLKAEWDRNYVGIVLEPPFMIPYGNSGIRIPNGKIVNPEILLFDEDGEEYRLEYSGSGGEETSRYAYKDDLPSNKSFKKILMRCDAPVKAEQILWSGYDAKDLK
jgi:hypothetical protein